MAAIVRIREHAIQKTDNFGIETLKSLNQDFVFVNDKLAGYLTWADKKFKPLIGWNNVHNPMVCQALEGLKGEEFGKITWIDAPEMPAVEDNEDDE